MSTVHAETSLPRNWSPAESEPSVRERWDEAGIGHAQSPTDDGTSYAIIIPPPNVTSALHLGHALNNTLQDILVRYHRMRGDSTLWMPGTDHAGIATQTVVEKRLIQTGRSRKEIGREAFLELAQEWKDEYEAVILGQLRELGASCDWARTRFTMDPVCTKSVRHAFFTLFADGLIDRGKRLVNWDPATGTALADDEVEMQEVAGHMWYLRYPLEDERGHVTVATTRPETMLGDTAVAINPNDPRAEALRGKHVILPIVGRRIPIIEDDHVIMAGSGDDPKAEFATGFLKVTPAHDPNDWDIGLRHDLEVINTMAPDGSISNRHGWDDSTEECRPFIGLSREDARKSIVAWFQEHDLLENIRDYTHSVGHSYRSHVPIEPYLSDQWYVRVTDDRLRGAALRAMDTSQRQGDFSGPSAPGDGELTFFPDRYARLYQHWHEGLRDWCISRQLWWGHRIPVWTCVCDDPGGLPDAPLALVPSGHDLPMCDLQDDAFCVRMTRDPAEGKIILMACVDHDRPDLESQLEMAGFAQDPDVLDTWFSSALWPMSTMGWPDPEAWEETRGLLDTFNPTNVLCTGGEIITLWVSRMVMFNRYFLGRLPFRHVYIHPMVQDGHGQKMSKSLGNGVDPRDIIHSHGTDALRLVMAQIATSTQDVRLPVEVVDPHDGESFVPEWTTSPSGHVVAAAIQRREQGEMVTAYGLFSGETVTAERPLAKNTSSRFDVGRNFANKIWNASRFALGRIESPQQVQDLAALPLPERWMLTRLSQATATISDSIDRYRFSDVAAAAYDIVWRDFCDWYLEAIKPSLSGDGMRQQVLATVLDGLLRLLHPICPFVTETIWHHLRAATEPGLPGFAMPSADMLALAPWPSCDWVDEGSLTETARLQSLVGDIRRVRSENDIPSKSDVRLLAPEALTPFMDMAAAELKAMCRVAEIATAGQQRPQGAMVLHFEGEEVLIEVAGAFDLSREKSRLESRRDELQSTIQAMEKRLSNSSYVEKAPAHLVEQTRSALADAQSDLNATLAALDALA